MLKNQDNQFITKKILETTIDKKLDKAFEKQTKVILKAVDLRIGDAKNELKTDIGKVRKELKTDIGNVRNELKTDISDLRKELKTDVAVLKIDVAELGEKVGENTEKIDKVLEQQDGIVKLLIDLKEESKAGFAIYKRHDSKIENHEERIGSLEIKIQAAK
ncbi:MAG: hypothetical protein ABH887_00560 [bacterium]